LNIIHSTRRCICFALQRLGPPRPLSPARSISGRALRTASSIRLAFLRTLSFAGGFVAQALLVLAIFKLI
jgi:hypothetical protein